MGEAFGTALALRAKPIYVVLALRASILSQGDSDMGTTKQDIRAWLERGKEKGASHMIVVCDTYDWDDYPVFVKADEDVREVENRYVNGNMTKVMEVYRLDRDWDEQLNMGRAFCY